MSDYPSVEALAESVAAATPTPGGGAVAAVVAALAAALAAMVVRLALAKADEPSRSALGQLVEDADDVRRRLLALSREDEAAYRAVLAARRAGDHAALTTAWREAARVPADVVRESREVVRLARKAAMEGPPRAIGDAVMAALLAAAAAAGSHLNVRLNAEAAGRPGDLRVLAEQSEVLLREAERTAEEVRKMGEQRLRG